jgi:hypothetical protein
MKSLIADLTDGAEVVMRTIHDRVVVTVYGHDDLYFTAVAPGRGDDECEYYPLDLVAEWELPLVKRGAWFWLVVENVRGPHGHMERQAAIAFQHEGVATAEEAFASRPDGAA